MSEGEPTAEDLAFGERVSKQFNLGLIATAKAVTMGNEENWLMPMKHYIEKGFIETEKELNIYLDPVRRKFVFDLVVGFLEEHRISCQNRMLATKVKT